MCQCVSHFFSLSIAHSSKEIHAYWRFKSLKSGNEQAEVHLIQDYTEQSEASFKPWTLKFYSISTFKCCSVNSFCLNLVYFAQLQIQIRVLQCLNVKNYWKKKKKDVISSKIHNMFLSNEICSFKNIQKTVADKGGAILWKDLDIEC